MLGKIVIIGMVVTLSLGLVAAYGERQYTAGGRDLLTSIEQARAKDALAKQEIDDAINTLSFDDLLERALGTVQP